MKTILIVLATAGAWLTYHAAAQDFPSDQLAELQECTIRIHCEVQQEDRISGPVAAAKELTYSGICIMGCINVCNKNACWCEVDEKCER